MIMNNTPKEQIKITVDTTKPSKPIRNLYGIFFEDINHAADGGLYAEMVQNRSFEFGSIDNPSYRALTAWRKVEEDGKLDWMISTKDPCCPDNPHYLVLRILKVGEKIGICNDGFAGGMYVEEGKRYHFVCRARVDEGAVLKIYLASPSGEVGAEGMAELETKGIYKRGWRMYGCTLTAEKGMPDAHLEVIIKNAERLELDFVSLMPEDTYKGRRNGMRRDLAEALEELRPKFMRFPGGCLVHDGTLEEGDRASMYRWKNTLGNPADRPARRNNWGYNQTLGLGFYEYFLLCEDIGAEPVPVVPGGYNPHTGEAVPMEEMEPWVQDALDLIEFANGDPQTQWGAVRAGMGHPEPFGMKYIAIGNEEVGDAFWERYPLFHKAIRAQYPEVRIINSAGPFAYGEAYEMGWSSARKWGSDLVDEHYYNAPEWMIANHHHYDGLENGPKVFLGEYASCGNVWKNALAEASYMIGLERNADKVEMACYAPLFCNKNYKNWDPDLIWFDNSRVSRSASYYVQKLFMCNQGDYCLECESEGLEIRPWEEKELLLENYTERFGGRIQLTGIHGDMQFTEITAKNPDTGEQTRLSWVRVKDGKAYSLECGDWENMDICFRAKQPGVGRGFTIRFGMEDDDNYYGIDFGCGQADTFLRGRRKGANFILSHSSVHIEEGCSHRIEVLIRKRRVRALVDGRECLDVECRALTAEKLYFTASREGENDIIVKLANVTDSRRSGILVLRGVESAKGKVWRMQGYAENACNILGEPEQVAPVEEDVEAEGNCLPFELDGKALAVYRLTAGKTGSVSFSPGR